MSELTDKPTDQQTKKPTSNEDILEGKIEFQIENLGEEDMRMLYDQASGTIEEGKVIAGKILRIERDGVLVDIGYKSEGIIPMYEFGENLDDYSPGDEVDVLLEEKENLEGMVVLSKIKAEKQKRWEKTIENSNEGDMVKGKITRKVRGGLIVDIGMDAFLPASQIDIKHISYMDGYVGQTHEFRILKINSERKNIVVSRRVLLEEERLRNREKLLEEIEVGQLREGMVKNITDFGAFIDLNGLDGLLHITDMTWGRISHPSEMLAIGDNVSVMVLDYDQERQRIALGLKQKEPNPWDSIEQKYPVGSIIKGRIVNLLPYGAFIEIERGIEGLIHISEISWTKRITDPSEVLSVGDIIEAMVLNIKKDEAKISLGIKQTEFNPWSVVEEKYPPGTKIKGKVRNVTSYGAFVEIEEGIDGLIHVSDMSWTKKINHPSEIVKKGEDVEAIIIAVDQEAKKITLGLKQLEDNPWDRIDDLFKIGDVIECTAERLAEYGVFVALPHNMESLIHISQLSDKPVQKVDQVVSTGDKFAAKVVKIDQDNRKIILSVREYLSDIKMAQDKTAQPEEKEEAPEVTIEVEDIPKEQIPSAMEAAIDSAMFQVGDQAAEPETPAEETPATEEVAETPTEEAPPEIPAEETPATEEVAETPTEEAPPEIPAEETPATEEVAEAPTEEALPEIPAEETPTTEEVAETPMEEAPPEVPAEETVATEEVAETPMEETPPEIPAEETVATEEVAETPTEEAPEPEEPAEVPAEETSAPEDKPEAEGQEDSEEPDKTAE